MNQATLLVAIGLSTALWGCAAHWIENDEHAYLHQEVESTADLVLPEGVTQPDAEVYMPVPDQPQKFPAMKEGVDFKPPVEDQ